MEGFHRDEERRAYLRFLAEEAGRFRVDILCWCLMSNQVPVLAVPHQETSLARAFGEAHRRDTRLKNFAECVRGVSSRDGSTRASSTKITCFQRHGTGNKSRPCRDGETRLGVPGVQRTVPFPKSILW